MKILVGLLALAVVEIVLLVALGATIGFWPTLLWILVTAVAGILLLRGRGMPNALPGQTEFWAPGNLAAHRALVAVAGFLLVLPGPLADTCGLLLLLPVIRSLVIRQFAARVISIHRPEPAELVIEAEWHEDAAPPEAGPERPPR